jgi:hypothetical protein
LEEAAWKRRQVLVRLLGGTWIWLTGKGEMWRRRVHGQNGMTEGPGKGKGKGWMG